MSTSKKTLLKSIFKRNAGCGGCGKPKLSDVVEPDSKPIIPSTAHNPKPRFSPSSSCDRNGGLSLEDEEGAFTSTTISLQSEPETDPTSTRLPSPATIADTVAVEKDSDDPYHDFRCSMLHIINEKKIYSRTGLQELLKRFLALNSPYHHGSIVKAFMEIWDEFVYNGLIVISDSDQ